MKTIADLNEALFAQLERLTKPDLSKDELNFEINRTRSIVSVSAQIINNLMILQKVRDINSKKTALTVLQKEHKTE